MEMKVMFRGDLANRGPLGEGPEWSYRDVGWDSSSCRAPYDSSARTVSSNFLVSLMPSASLALLPSYSTPIQLR